MEGDRVTKASRFGPNSIGRGLLGAGVWVFVAAAALRVADLPDEFGGSLCGVWGCYPPMQALAAMHLFWLVVMAPVVWAFARLGRRGLRRAGAVMVVAATLAMIGYVGWDVTAWVQRVREEFRPLWPKRAAYTLLTASDLPLIQTFLAGAVCVVLGRARRDTAGPSAVEPTGEDVSRP